PMVFLFVILDVNISGPVGAHIVSDDLRMHAGWVTISTNVQTGRWGKDGTIKSTTAISTPFNHLSILVSESGTRRWIPGNHHKVIVEIITTRICTAPGGVAVKTAAARELQLEIHIGNIEGSVVQNDVLLVILIHIRDTVNPIAEGRAGGRWGFTDITRSSVTGIQ